jgi:methionyl-tRNA formyltransferase
MQDSEQQTTTNKQPTNNNPRIIFMGTPEFAVASLDALVQAGCNIIAVITAPDKPAGRGMKLTESAVKKYAVDKQLPVLQPVKLKDPEFLETLKGLQADLQIVVAFRMLPVVVWDMPPMGTINLHGSLLPQYRGAAPINWAVINGEKETGVTTFKLQHEIDTGNILLQESFAIGDDETAGDVHDKMKEIGAQLLVKTVKGLADGSLTEIPQQAIDNGQLATLARRSETEGGGNEQSAAGNSPLTINHALLKHAPKIFTETCKIDWNQSVTSIYNLIRGLAPYPAAFTYLNDKMLKIYKAKKEMHSSPKEPGTFETDNKTYLKFAGVDGYIHIIELQLEGKKKMTIEEFLRGFRLPPAGA